MLAEGWGDEEKAGMDRTWRGHVDDRKCFCGSVGRRFVTSIILSPPLAAINTVGPRNVASSDWPW